MGQYQRKPVIIEAFTFDELVDYGRKTNAHQVNGMPWNFDFRGKPVTHETDTHYIVDTFVNVTPNHMLIIGEHGDMYSQLKVDFDKSHKLTRLNSEFK